MKLSILPSYYFLLVAASSAGQQNSPKVTTRNGTIIGTSNAFYKVDSFLGIPYAQPPIGPLRFNVPQPLVSTWPEPIDGSAHGPHCLGYSLNLEGFTQKGIDYPQSEDCLTLNIVRPKEVPENASLPVLVWIPGGAFEDGGSGDARYNLTYLVANSVEMGMPTIVASMNYRLSGWGYLTNNELFEAGLANFGIHDQRLALSWIQENIASFGGDPTRITISGESAGAMSVGSHLLTYAGVDEDKRPFRAAIAQSGGPFIPVGAPSLADLDARYPKIVDAAGCSSAEDGLACLRSAPTETLITAFRDHQPWRPISDGHTSPMNAALALETGNFSMVPLLIGANTNEGTSFYRLISLGINETSQYTALFQGYAGSNPFSDETMELLLQQYSALDLSQELGSVNPTAESALGSKYGQASIIVGDYMFTAGRRIASQIWAEHGVPAYSYRFHTVPAGVLPHTLGVAHFQEIAFVFGDISGAGWNINPFAVEPPERRARYEALATLIPRMWLSFVNTLSPNNHGVSSFSEEWPAYSNYDPVNMVFDGNGTSFLERDNWRREPIETIRSSAVSWRL